MNNQTAGVDLDKLPHALAALRALTSHIASNPAALDAISLAKYEDAVEAEGILECILARRAEPSVAAGDASALLNAAMKDAYAWIGQCITDGWQPEKLEVDKRIVKFIVARAAIASSAAQEGK
jgi:hypothetical protein